METTIEKTVNLKGLKDQIKNEAKLQKALKQQRKDANFKGERFIQPKEAAWKVYIKGQELRIMYAAYGLMRGKKFSQIENHYSEENHPLNKYIHAINKCIEIYTEKENNAKR